MGGYRRSVAAFTSRDTCQVAGVTYRQLDYWVRMGLVHPPVPASGSGSQRLFDVREVQVVWALGQLSQLGQGLPELDVLRTLPDCTGYLVAYNGGVAHAADCTDVWQYGPAVVLVDLAWAPFAAGFPAAELAGVGA